MHVYASGVLIEALVQRLLSAGLRAAGPGEFTARAYLNGKLDLAQAEAVNEIIAGSNRLQLNAAERLLSGRLTKTTDAIRSDLLDCLSLIEAGLDFSGEEIEFISAEQSAERLGAVERRLEELLAGNIRYESLLDLPSIGIAGAPNAGKSSLLNALLGQDRSIVSDQPKTTRDVLSGILTVVPARPDRLASGTNQPSSFPASHFKLQTSNSIQCVLFDCAGLLAAPESILDRLAQQAATEALRHCSTVLFCVDLAKADWSEDLAIRTLIEAESVIYVATKSDLLAPDALQTTLEQLASSFAAAFLPASVKTGRGLDELRSAIHASQTTGEQVCANEGIALTTRHRQAVCEAIENVRQASGEVAQGNEELAATLIRAAHASLAGIAQQPIDEQILDRIFSHFCIGK
ncbi:MAG: 50S ribosome-binding GTPase [Sedimentisphaerales bacterium]|nr:50S ribosome-binding GTPase [Sedimentisphaerales bacterium]